ncbi:transferase, hexapeptide repeat protein [Pseudomonas syringae pv. theae ICMP 3923]|uniref:Transferase, hexapeptide repeat protein n=2 Tax=Pseudomonas syringae TaxID=317 RepID=A0A0Q0G3I7_PSESX|nr:acetyltransferase [Pseudomonas syringae]EPM68581.1 transferase, hexapeptide repeat protein [Pseudomonas syringae pv. theae ICMP 3923]KPZ30891.1 hypothetical protein AN901_205309 [Pseudomonas syringae pv. theae]MBL3828588.1 acetyltransferase [Pseudomonas syringae pv. theae]MBL3835133.1 acetyltransferase [Pseudomonas syringae pv. theae]MBL3865703.1 acetyltransferase [Pseudomonas syringae pv. theae]
MNTKKLIIVGAGSFGREVHQWLEDWIAFHPDWSIAGFIDDTKTHLGNLLNYSPVLGSIAEYAPAADEYLVCAIATPEHKKAVVTKLLGRGAQFFTLVHPTAIVGKNVIIGEGSVICPHAILSVDLEIGAFATINSASTVAHDVKMGKFVTLSLQCDVTGGVILGDEVFLGSRASVLPHIHVGHKACIGAGSVVNRSVAPGLTVVGVPARKIEYADGLKHVT